MDLDSLVVTNLLLKHIYQPRLKEVVGPITLYQWY